MQRIAPFRALDAFRGLAATWVVMAHCASPLLTGGDPRYVREPLYNFASRGQLGVMLFFVISGYCIVGAAYGALISGKPVWRYGYERIRRIYPPYISALLLGVAAFLLVGYAGAHHLIAPPNHPYMLEHSLRYWVGNLFLLQSELGTNQINIVFWSLCYEVAFYAIVGIWLWIAQVVAARRGLAEGTFTFIAGIYGTTFLSLLCLTVFGGAMFPFDMWHQFAVGGVLFFLIESNPGTVAGYSQRLRWILNGSALAISAMMVVFAWTRELGEHTMFHPSSRVRAIFCLLICVVLAAMRPVDARLMASRWVRPLLWLGACSYSLYLIHSVVIPFLNVPLRKAGLDGSRYWITFWIEVAFAIATGRLFYHLVERRFVSTRQKERLREEHVA
jgi:peptidoglycan/LPS O-acetylase OafA/YrhL